VFQSYALFPHYNVFNNIAYGLRLRKLADAQISGKVNNIIALVGLQGMEDRFPNQISGGQQQRV
ncbi:MAG TPA: polyamine ABC transporter ATP-binding protein, partial [Ruminiclostridium sp.]|nr:polyamine ABC transporter ATP-binding protein [Ruminiclostridium sp.]